MATAALPNADTFGQLVAPEAPRHRAISRLYASFKNLDPSAPFEAQVDSLIALSRYIRANGGSPPTPDAKPGDTRQTLRLLAVIRAIEQIEPCREALAGVVRSVLTQTSALELLARLGIPVDRGFFGETIDRLSRRFLPEPTDPRDAIQLVAQMFSSRADVRWLAAMPTEVLGRFLRALDASDAPDDHDPEHAVGPARDVGAPRHGGSALGGGAHGGSAHGGSADTSVGPFRPLRDVSLDAVRLIAARVSAVGLYDALRTRGPKVPLEDSPFFLLPRITDAFVAAVRDGEPSRTLAAAERCHDIVARCMRTVGAVIESLERTGVSVDVVYRLELIDKSLVRHLALVDALAPNHALEHAGHVKRLFVALLDARAKDRALGDIVQSSLHLLARKIIERAGDSGEHYITTTRGDYAKMLLSAGGGGFLTTGTAALKFFIAWGHFAPFVEGMLAATNYAGSFLLMQFCGLTLATKQPSMTAAALAGSMRDSAGKKDLSHLVTLIARITRSQLAAAIGNVGVVIPTALAFDHVWQGAHQGKSFLDAEAAHYVLHSLHPTESGTIFYAALTGVLLWASSVGAGWLENWSAYRRIPEAIAEHRIGRFIGRRTTAWAARVFRHNISGIGGNSTLGLLLGMTPVLGKFFGLPLDVRHVTLSTGALTLAVSALGSDAVSSPDVTAAALGIAIIGTLNFGVSFVLALLLALRAREVEWRDRLRLLASVVITFLRSPLQFVFPPAAPLATPVHGPASIRPPAAH